MLTVLIATHNGAGTLPEVLEAYGRLHSPEGGWKLVIVDNASTDETERVLRSFARLLPLLSIHVAEQGQNLARNRGLAEVAGDLVVFADDDALPHADWLARLRAAADAHPDFGLFGGAVRPRWEVSP
ncbi:MAG: glycosyltransferase, partial [Thermoanaerobaculia bacterium]